MLQDWALVFSCCFWSVLLYTLLARAGGIGFSKTVRRLLCAAAYFCDLFISWTLWLESRRQNFQAKLIFFALRQLGSSLPTTNLCPFETI
jgi:hypothetical protein